MSNENNIDIGDGWLTASLDKSLHTTTELEEKILCWKTADKIEVQGPILEVLKFFNRTAPEDFVCRVTLKPQWINSKVKDILPFINDFDVINVPNFGKIDDILKHISHNLNNLSSHEKNEMYQRDNYTKDNQVFESLVVCLNKEEICSTFLNNLFGYEKSENSFYEINNKKELENFEMKLKRLSGDILCKVVFDINEDIWSYIQRQEKLKLDSFYEDTSIDVINGNQLQISSKKGDKKVEDALEYIVSEYQKYSKDIVTHGFNLEKPEDFGLIKESMNGKPIHGSCLFKVTGPKSNIDALIKKFQYKKTDISDQKTKNYEEGRTTLAANNVKHQHTLDSGLKIFISKGNLIHQKTDAIVNPANCKLSHGGGAAKIISDAAGEELEWECREFIKRNGSLSVSQVMHTTSGNLRPNIKFVIHTVGPKMPEKTKDVKEIESLLINTFLNCFRYANDKLSISSVAVPAISSGIFGVPLEIVGSAMFVALEIFDKRRTSTTLKEIHFVNLDDKTVNSVSTAFNNWMEKSSAKRHNDGSTILDLTNNMPKTHEGRKDKIFSSSYRSCGESEDMGDVIKESRKLDQCDKHSDCVICIDKITNPEQLKCGHVFCKSCLDTYNKKCNPKCPVCGIIYGELKGNQPPGNMTVSEHGYSLPGYDGCSTLEISYHFQDGVQDDTHPNPGHKFRGTKRTAYLPNNREGSDVYRMFRKAFDNKLLFTVGRSMTTGREDSITWNDIHQKTQFSGEFGYPDPGYLKRVKEELAAKGIFAED